MEGPSAIKEQLLCDRISGMLMQQFACCGLIKLVDRLVDNLTTQQPAFQLSPQQVLLSLGSFHEASVLLSAARQIGNDFVHRSIGNVLINWESCLACFQHEIDISYKSFSNRNTMYAIHVRTWCNVQPLMRICAEAEQFIS